jgi:hypothetical protein
MAADTTVVVTREEAIAVAAITGAVMAAATQAEAAEDSTAAEARTLAAVPTVAGTGK